MKNRPLYIIVLRDKVSKVYSVFCEPSKTLGPRTLEVYLFQTASSCGYSSYMYNWRDPNAWKGVNIETGESTMSHQTRIPTGMIAGQFGRFFLHLPQPRNDPQNWIKLAKADRHPGWVFHAVNLGNMSAGFSQSDRHFFATVYLSRPPWYSNAAATIEISQWRTCGSSVGIKILIIWLHQIWWLSAFRNMKCVCVCACVSVKQCFCKRSTFGWRLGLPVAHLTWSTSYTRIPGRIQSLETPVDTTG